MWRAYQRAKPARKTPSAAVSYSVTRNTSSRSTAAVRRNAGKARVTATSSVSTTVTRGGTN